MNAKTEKRLGLMAAFLLTAAIFVAPNPIQQQQKIQFLSMTGTANQAIHTPYLLAQNSLSDQTIR